MEVTIVDTGSLPSSTIISFHTGSVRRHAQLEQNRAINLSYAPGSSPIRVDLMSQVGSHTFDMVPTQDVYDIPIKSEAGGPDVKLKFQIRDVSAGDDKAKPAKPEAEEDVGSSPSRKLHTALMMRSYLDNHDVLRKMQELLQDMVSLRPDDPIEYMIGRLEQVGQDSNCNAIVTDNAPAKAGAPADEKKRGKSKEKADDDSEDEEDDADEVEEQAAMPPPTRTRKASVSAEAYGAYNQRKAYEPKVVAKTQEQRERLEKVLKQCWMFRDYSPENLGVVANAMVEKEVAAGEKLINQGDMGDVMWVIEDGTIECWKPISGVDTMVKSCKRGDVFGELALLYNCPRAASVSAKDKSLLWELDRDTFQAICYEAATKTEQPSYEGFCRNAAKGDDKIEAPVTVTEAPEVKEEDDESEGEDVQAQTLKAPKAKKPARRQGVSAEMGCLDDESWSPPVYGKTPEERQSLSDIIKTSRDSKLHMLFGTVSKEVFEQIIDATFLKKIAIGEKVMEQGGVADNFYIVKEGHFDIIVKKGDDPPKKVFEAGVGFAFGELALLYNAPRSATIAATIDSQVWSLDRTSFRNLVVKASEAQFKQYVEFLSGVDIFHVLNENERASLAEVLEEENFEDDEAILEQGEQDDKMFIIRAGNAVACIKGEQGEVEVMQYSKGDYFGEIALLLGEPRKASVYAVGPCTCLYISRETFIRILGPLTNILERNLGRYAKYADAMSKAEAPDSKKEDPGENQEEDETAEPGALKSKNISRKRVRVESSIPETPSKTVNKELDTEGEPQSLADKVALDFKNDALVTPTKEFENQDSQIMVYGGIILGQKFTDDKVMLWNGKIPPIIHGEDDTFAWNATTKLKHNTAIAVICQKGQKSAADPTPNQDNYFVHHINGVSMYGICDGHGPFGHLVSYRLVQSIPYFLAKNSNWGSDWALALKEAFLAAQDDLEKFCGLHSINIEASGAAGSVLVLDEQTVHVAFIGDARIMLGSWNRRDSRLIFCTSDHKPNVPEEKARLEAAGSEVREIDPDNHRIYLPGQNFPGLTMSRAFGDTACKGVLREPEYHKFLMQPTDEWYAIVASDGIWEFLEGTEACTLTSKKLRLKGPRETLNFLVNAARKRWAHCCGDYCDDITGVLVQWNTHDKKDEKSNHTLCVKRVAEKT